MTINQLETLTESELEMILYIVNIIDPMTFPKVEFQPRTLTWFKHKMLVQKLVNAFPRVLPEGHATYQSLMNKLGVQGEIRYETPSVTPPAAEITSSNPLTSSI